MKAKADCCSTSSLCVGNVPSDFKHISHLVGKKIWKFEEVLPASYEEADSDGPGDMMKEHSYIFATTNNEKCYFKLVNWSNGYYDGWLALKWNKSIPEELVSLVHIHPSSALLFVVVGLPGSGKTVFASKLRAHLVHEYIPGCHNQAIFRSLTEGLRVCLVSSYLTDFTVYQKQIVDEFLPFISVDRIITYCFLPNLDRSIANNKRRGGINFKEKENDIRRMSSYYDPVNKPYLNKRLVETFVNASHVGNE
eukprot:TRINITY_DN12747_c0_g1_i2.p1 TRINITY_DN12747_c0_g1~~TRINITY_DN12747_c0_g1_i2.p1  ORF type:complete len:251 (+),score=39.25 TRINITY_DN12747_c0_g1_i2:137-889(+)